MPSCRAASILAWPAIRPPSSPTSAGVVQPHSLMLAAIAATWASVWVRAFFAYGISRSIALHARGGVYGIGTGGESLAVLFDYDTGKMIRVLSQAGFQ